MYLFTQGEHVVSFSVERRKTQEHTLVADISISCPCPGFSPLITWASRCIKSSASPERALQLVCSREGWAVCLCLHPDSTAALHYYGEKCMEKNVWKKMYTQIPVTGVSNQAWRGEKVAAWSLLLSHREEQWGLRERGGFSQQRCIFNRNELSYSTFPWAVVMEPCVLQ